MRRSSRACFESEMLCNKPSLENVVFDEFEPDIHVKEVDYNPNLPLYRSLDFGFINPFVCLWIQVDDQGNVRVIDEYLRHRATIHIHARQIKQQTPGQVTATFCDPAGQSPNDVTGTSTIRELKSLAIPTRYRKSTILEGIELIRRALRSGDSKSSLVISPKCDRLIEAMQCYHYPDQSEVQTELPLKDGVYDHPIDALRYFFVNYTKSGIIYTRIY
jgi:phage terminase large subunit